jgi:hypothetical protein
MGNSIYNRIAVWRNEGENFEDAKKIIQTMIEEGLVKPVFLKLIPIDSPFSRKKVSELFQKAEHHLKPSGTKYKKYDTSDFPKDLRDLEEKQKMLYEEMSRLRGELYNVLFTRKGTPRRSPNLRRSESLAFQILSNDREIKSIYEKLDYYHDHKKRLPGTEPKKSMSDLKHAAQLLQEQVESVNYIRKQNTYKKKNGVLQNPDKYRECQNTLKQIDEFIEKHGR